MAAVPVLFGSKDVVALSPEASEVAKRCLAQIEGRGLAGGGFSGSDGGDFRPDATAWAVMALRATGVAPDRMYAARDRLVKAQSPDGSVPVSPDQPKAVWPTALAALAWHGEAPFADAETRALGYLLGSGGIRWQERADEAEMAVDPRLWGWSWVLGTFSWVEPTALALMALTAGGHATHARAKEAAALLLDRQLAGGGWNFGATRVYRNVHAASPEMTGLVLVAARDHVPRETVDKSIGYVRGTVGRYMTPLALGWGLLGLAAWDDAPDGAAAWLGECLGRQGLYGPYDTTYLALLVLAAMAHHSGVGPLFSGVRS